MGREPPRPDQRARRGQTGLKDLVIFPELHDFADRFAGCLYAWGSGERRLYQALTAVKAYPGSAKI